MKNQKSQFKCAFFKAVAPSFALVFLCSCSSSVYDMRQLDQPVVLNNNPFLISETAASPKIINVDTYSATIIREGDGVTSDGAVTASATNTAQLNAFLKIGGEPNYFIHNISLRLTPARIRGGPISNPLDIEATGEVAEIQIPLLQPARSQKDPSLTNQLTSPQPFRNNQP